MKEVLGALLSCRTFYAATVVGLERLLRLYWRIPAVKAWVSEVRVTLPAAVTTGCKLIVASVFCWLVVQHRDELGPFVEWLQVHTRPPNAMRSMYPRAGTNTEEVSMYKPGGFASSATPTRRVGILSTFQRLHAGSDVIWNTYDSDVEDGTWGNARQVRHPQLLTFVIGVGTDAQLLGRPVRVLWGKGQSWTGTIDEYDSANRRHHVSYADGDARWYKLSKKTFWLLDEDVPSSLRDECVRGAVAESATAAGVDVAAAVARVDNPDTTPDEGHKEAEGGPPPSAINPFGKYELPPPPTGSHLSAAFDGSTGMTPEAFAEPHDVTELEGGGDAFLSTADSPERAVAPPPLPDAAGASGDALPPLMSDMAWGDPSGWVGFDNAAPVPSLPQPISSAPPTDISEADMDSLADGLATISLHKEGDDANV